MRTLILREGGEPFVVASVKEDALDDREGAVHFVERLEAGEFDMLICLTGVGMGMLRDLCASAMPRDRLVDALRDVTIVARGPKPVGVLRNLGVPIHVTIPEPNTWREIVAAVSQRPERRIAVQEYGQPNENLHRALEELGATVTPVVLYRWELPDDVGPLRQAVSMIAGGECDVVLFTSRIQFEHLLRIAASMGLEAEVTRALKERLAVGSIGEIVNDTLAAEGIQPDIVPRHPKMWDLVKTAAEQSASVLVRKRTDYQFV